MARDAAALEVDDDMLAVGHRRRIAAAAVAVLALHAGAELLLPQLLAVEVVAYRQPVLAVDDRR